MFLGGTARTDLKWCMNVEATEWAGSYGCIIGLSHPRIYSPT